MVKTKLRGLALLRTFLVTGKLHEHKTDVLQLCSRAEGRVR